MAYWLDEGWHSWPEIVRAGTPAAGLYARCGSYIADHTTDGYIPSGVVNMYGTVEWARRLVDVGLWAVEGDGYRDLRYFPLNPSRATVEKRRAAAAARQRRHRNAKQTRESRVTGGVTSRVTSLAPTPPKGVGASRKRDDALPPPHPFENDGTDSCKHCPLPKINKIHPQ